MKRFLFVGAILTATLFAVSSPAQAQYYYYRRPAARVAARLALPPYPYARPWYGPGYYRPTPYSNYYGPRAYGYGNFGYGGWGFGPGAYVGFGVF